MEYALLYTEGADTPERLNGIFPTERVEELVQTLGAEGCVEIWEGSCLMMRASTDNVGAVQFDTFGPLDF